MLRKLVFCFTLSVAASCALAQSTPLANHIELVKLIMPEATRLGLIYKTGENIERDIQSSTQETDMIIVKAPVRTIREISKVMRTLANYDVDFVVMVEDRIVTSSNAIKGVVKQTLRDSTPVFSTAEDSLQNGALGRFERDPSGWLLKINGKLLSRFENVQVPQGNDRIVVEE